MSCIYVATGVQGGRPSLKFQERELNLAPTTVEDSGIMAVPRPQPSIHYRTAIDWIHVSGAAILDKKVYNVQPESFNALKRISDQPPVLAPTLALKLAGTGEAEKEQLKAWGMTESTQSRGTVWLGRPSLVDFRQLVSVHGMHDEPVPAGNASPVGYYSFFMGWKAVGLFSVVSNAHSATRGGLMFSGEPDKVLLVKNKEKVRVLGGINEDIETSGMADTGTRVYASPLLTPVFSPVKKVASASNYVWSLTESIDGTGFVFPYFHGMLLPSRDYTGTTFFRHFSACFSNNDDDFKSTAPMIRRGFRNLQATKAGMELQHIMFGVDLASGMGAGLKPFVEGGQYLGFALTRGSGVILDKNTIREPLSNAELLEARAALSVHTTALLKVQAILTKYPMMTGEEEEFDIVQYRSSPRKLADHLIQRDLSSAETADLANLKDALEKLVFDQEYWPITAGNIEILLRAIMTGRWMHPEAPYYHGKGCGLSMNSIVRCLAVFGPEVPDIFVGSEIRSISRVGKDDPNLVVKNGHRERLPYIPVYSQPILTAAGHWKAVQNQAQLRFYPNRKGKKEFTNRMKLVTEIAGDSFDRFYGLLREYVGQKDSDTVISTKGKKRAALEDMDLDAAAIGSASGSVNKKARVDIGSLF